MSGALWDLRSKLRRQGYYQRPVTKMLTQLCVHALLAGAGLAVFLLDSRWPVRIGGFIVWTAGNLGIGTNTHTSSHGATSRKRWVNQLLTYLGYPVYSGLSATY